jgi:hypothetical protein
LTTRPTAKTSPVFWNIPVDRIPTARGLAYPDIIESAVQGTERTSMRDRRRIHRNSTMQAP